MALRPKVIDLIRLHTVDNVRNLLRIRQVPVVKKELRPRFMRVYIDMVNTGSIESACPADNAMDLVALGEQKLCKI